MTYCSNQNRTYNYFLFFYFSGGDSDDQATAESYWTPGRIQNVPEDDSAAFVQPEDYFPPPSRGLVQTHPATFSGFGSMFIYVMRILSTTGYLMRYPKYFEKSVPNDRNAL